MANELAIIGNYETLSQDEQKLVDSAIAMLDASNSLKAFEITQKRAFIMRCIAMRLNPLLNEVYATPYWDTNSKSYALGTIVDYKVYLSRAERSGQLDGWEINLTGKAVKTVVKKYKKGTNGQASTEYNAYVIDKEKSDLSGTITIWRKDWSRPWVSRIFTLAEEMKDTPFWHDDPSGMLEKALIKKCFIKVFPKDCDIVDFTQEDRIIAEEELPSGGNKGDKKKVVKAYTLTEILDLTSKAKALMQEFSLVSTTKDSYLLDIATAAKVLDGDEINKIIGKIEADKALAISRSKNAPKELPATPAPAEPKQEDFDTKICSECKKQNGHEAWCSFAPAPVKEQEEAPEPAQVIDTVLNNEIIAVLRELFSIDDYNIEYKRNSLNKHLPSVMLSPGSHNWQSAIENAAIPEAEGKEAIAYYTSCIPNAKAKKAKKDKDAKASKPPADMPSRARAAVAMLPFGEKRTLCEDLLVEAEGQSPDSEGWEITLNLANEELDRLKAERAGQ